MLFFALSFSLPPIFYSLSRNNRMYNFTSHDHHVRITIHLILPRFTTADIRRGIFTLPFPAIIIFMVIVISLSMNYLVINKR